MQRTGLLLLLVVATTSAAVERYDGYQVVRAVVRSRQDIFKLHQLQSTFLNGQLDVWKEARDVNQTSDMMVPPGFASELHERLDELHIAHHVAINDVQELLNSERSPDGLDKRATVDVLTRYASYADIQSWLNHIVSTCGARCSLLTIGTSALGQPLKVVKITGKSTTGRPIFVDGTVHAREWISPVMALNVINKLVTEYAVDAATTSLVDHFDWYVLPVVNPDGYEYSRTTSRMWRKNRRATSISSCPGVDLNRNFDYHWMESGTSTYPCDDTYGGPNAFSEPESRAMRDFLLRLGGGQRSMYLSFHSYGQYWLYPWGYANVQPADVADLKALATVGATAIRRASTGGVSTTYTIGTSAGALYPSAGGSDDWAKGVAGFKYSYTVELPPSDSAVSTGFVLPESKIPAVVKETWSGVKAAAQELALRSQVVG